MVQLFLIKLNELFARNSDCWRIIDIGSASILEMAKRNEDININEKI